MGSGLHRAYFAWSETNQQHTIVSSSFDSEHQRRKWVNRLRDHVRLQPTTAGPPPASALTLLRFTDDTAALVRRIRRGHSDGRNDATVLIGPDSLLDVDRAVAIELSGAGTVWSDEPPPNEQMSTVAPVFLNELPEPRPLPELAPFRGQLVEVLSRFLENPYQSVTVVGFPERERLVMAWGVWACLSLHQDRRFADRVSSFSTYEHRHDVGQPGLVFAPLRPSGGAVERTVVDLRSNAVRVRAPEAEQLVALLFGEQVNARPSRVPVENHAAPVPPEPPRTPPPNPVRPPTLPPPVVTAGRSLLLSGPSAQALLNQLQQERHNPREGIRKAFDVPEIDRVTALVEHGIRDEFLRTFLTVLYGPKLEDLRDERSRARRHAAELLARCESEQLAMLLGAAVRDDGPLAMQAYDRWTANGRLPARPTGQAARVAQAVRRSRRLTAVAIAAVVLFLGLVFGLGWAVGRPTAAAVPTTGTSEPAPQAVVPTTTEAPPAGKATGTAVVPLPDPTSVVVSFVRVGESYYPQDRCVAEGTPDTWRCPQVSQPPDKPNTLPGLVAIAVPGGEVPLLLAKAKGVEAVVRGAAWGAEQVVRP
ncbi:hypothetical protein [Actinosynnema sp. NPDC020468]|uniref:hypothetical protein n=1 Tax=Actinosynnema sp. NPDC020468 TaxID=3154488 RepID=UPI0033EDDB57